jgi:predicted TIM-barrel fold metal-dependent hydrolase
MHALRLIDAHTHVVAPDEAVYPFSPRSLSGEWYREAPCSADEFANLLSENRVDGAVLVQPVGAYSYDNAYAADSAARFPGLFASVCCIDVEAADAVATLEYWVRERGMHGVRLFALSRAERSWLAAPKTFPVWARAAELGVHAVVTIFEHQFGELRTVLEQFPEVPVSLDHCGFPPLAGAPWTEAQPLFALADLPNLHCKVTTNSIELARGKGGHPQSFIGELVRHFGADRVMWGSDFCQTHDRSYPELVALARDAFGELSPGQQAACLGGTAARLWPSLRVRSSETD